MKFFEWENRVLKSVTEVWLKFLLYVVNFGCGPPLFEFPWLSCLMNYITLPCCHQIIPLALLMFYCELLLNLACCRWCALLLQVIGHRRFELFGLLLLVLLFAGFETWWLKACMWSPWMLLYVLASCRWMWCTVGCIIETWWQCMARSIVSLTVSLLQVMIGFEWLIFEIWLSYVGG